jgi:hypothetical protein
MDNLQSLKALRKLLDPLKVPSVMWALKRAPNIMLQLEPTRTRPLYPSAITIQRWESVLCVVSAFMTRPYQMCRVFSMFWQNLQFPSSGLIPLGWFGTSYIGLTLGSVSEAKPQLTESLLSLDNWQWGIPVADTYSRASNSGHGWTSNWPLSFLEESLFPPGSLLLLEDKFFLMVMLFAFLFQSH